MNADAHSFIDPPPYPSPRRGRGTLVHALPRVFAILIVLLAGALSLWAGEDFTVSGTVRSASGAPLAGVALSVDEGTASTTTDAAGNFRLRVTPGDHRLRISNAGYGTVARPLAVTADVALDLRLDPVYRLTEDVVVQAIRAEAKAPITKKDLDRAEIERAYYGQEMPYLLKQAPSITQYSDTGMGAGYAYLYLRGIQQTRINLTLDGVPLSEPRTPPSTSSTSATSRAAWTASRSSAGSAPRPSGRPPTAARSTSRASRSRTPASSWEAWGPGPSARTAGAWPSSRAAWGPASRSTGAGPIRPRTASATTRG